MSLIVLLLASGLPVFLIGLFIYKKDNEKEPSKLLVRLFVRGILSTLSVYGISVLLSYLSPVFAIETKKLSGLDLIINVFIGVSLVEEFCKYLVVYRTAYNHKAHDYTFDMIVYSVFVALGFAFFENILYVATGGMTIALWRAVSAVPLHACLGTIIGIYLSKAKSYEIEGNRNKSNMCKFLGLLYPVLIHGLYDYCIFLATNLSLIVLIITIILTFVLTFKSIIKMSKSDKKLMQSNLSYSSCETIINDNYFPNYENKNE